MDPASEEIFSGNEFSVSDHEGPNFWVAPPRIDADLPNNNHDVITEEEERFCFPFCGLCDGGHVKLSVWSFASSLTYSFIIPF